MSRMRVGVRLGIDVGKARIGVAKSDAHGMLATPVETVQRDSETGSDIARLVQLIDEYDAFECVVGLPLNMQGKHTASTDDAVAFAQHIANTGTPVRLVDERLSTVTAWGHLHASGSSHKKGRGVIDQAAAVVILQQAIDTERLGGDAPGTLVNSTTTQEPTL